MCVPYRPQVVAYISNSARDSLIRLEVLQHKLTQSLEIREVISQVECLDRWVRWTDTYTLIRWFFRYTFDSVHLLSVLFIHPKLWEALFYSIIRYNIHRQYEKWSAECGRYNYFLCRSLVPFDRL